MINKLLFSLLFLYFPFFLLSQNTFTIHVTNQLKEPLKYPEISIPNKIHRIGANNGKLILNKDVIKLGDTILVRYMRYEPKYVPLNSELLASDSVNISLDEKIFLLEPIIIGKNDFNAEAFFKKKKKNLLLPYFREYHFYADFEFAFGDESTKKGYTLCQFKDAHVNIDTEDCFSKQRHFKNSLEWNRKTN